MSTDRPEPLTPAWHKWVERDRSCSQAMHRATAQPVVLLTLTAVSWLADGIVFYATMLALPSVGGAHGTACALRLFLLGLVNLLIYRVMKRHFARPRPFVACPGIRACTRSLDEYSFPSGHVLHAVAFAVLICAYYPSMFWMVWPFALLVALSRVVLGLHYPSDVIVAAVMGGVMATSVLALF